MLSTHAHNTSSRLTGTQPMSWFSPREDALPMSRFSPREDTSPMSWFSPREDTLPMSRFSPRENTSPMSWFSPRADTLPMSWFSPSEGTLPMRWFSPRDGTLPTRWFTPCVRYLWDGSQHVYVAYETVLTTWWYVTNEMVLTQCTLRIKWFSPRARCLWDGSLHVRICDDCTVLLKTSAYDCTCLYIYSGTGATVIRLYAVLWPYACEVNRLYAIREVTHLNLKKK